MKKIIDELDENNLNKLNRKNTQISNNDYNIEVINKKKNNKIPKQFTNKIQSKEKMMELITKNIFSYQKKEKEKENNKNKNFNLNNKIRKKKFGRNNLWKRIL